MSRTQTNPNGQMPLEAHRAPVTNANEFRHFVTDNDLSVVDVSIEWPITSSNRRHSLTSPVLGLENRLGCGYKVLLKWQTPSSGIQVIRYEKRIWNKVDAISHKGLIMFEAVHVRQMYLVCCTIMTTVLL